MIAVTVYASACGVAFVCIVAWVAWAIRQNRYARLRQQTDHERNR